MVKETLAKLIRSMTPSRIRELEAEVERLKGLQRGVPNPQALFEQLSKAFTGNNYGLEQKYHDFRAVFMRTSAGQRVLYEILDWTHIFAPVVGKDKEGKMFDPYVAHYQDGERNVGLKILSTLNAEPVVPQDAEETERENPDQGEFEL